MMTLIRIVIALPLLLILVLFALSNPGPATFHFWPTDYTADLPLSLAVLGAMALAFVAGAVVLWTDVIGARGRARRAERQVRALEAQVAALKARQHPAETRNPLLPAS